MNSFLLRNTKYSQCKNNLLFISKDVTELKRAEQVLSDSERDYKSLFDNMQDGLAYCQMFFENDKPDDFIEFPGLNISLHGLYYPGLFIQKYYGRITKLSVEHLCL